MGTLDDEQDDQKAKISNLFEHELLPHVSQTSNQKQFTKLNEIYLFQVNSPHWVGDEYWSKFAFDPFSCLIYHNHIVCLFFSILINLDE